MRTKNGLARELAWAGQLPEAYKVLPLRAVARQVREKNRDLEDSNLLSLSYGNIVRRDINSDEGLLPSSFENYTKVQSGDLVLRLTDLQNDKRSLRSGKVKESGIITSAYVSLRPCFINPDYFSYFFRAFDLAKVFYSLGSGLRQSLTYQEIKSIPIIVPPEIEQRRIAEFLDRETAEIDAFIADQQRCKTLLEERQRSVRFDYFSGLSEQQAPLKYFGQFLSGSGFPISEQGQAGNELPFFKVGSLGVAKGNVLQETEDTVSRETASRLGARIIPENSVVMAKIGAALFLNRNALLKKPSCIDNNMLAIVPFDDVYPEFLQQALALIDVAPYANPGAVPSLNMGWIKKHRLWKPPLEVQRSVFLEFFVEQEAVKDMAADLDRVISLSQERRAALISAAVTGKIDVSDRYAAEKVYEEVESRQ